MPDYRKEWLQKADIDYFAPFVNLWLACNSWYKSHYSDLSSANDRDFINAIKKDYSGRNHLFVNFKRIIASPAMEGIYFRSNLEQLHYSLERVRLSPERIDHCSFTSAVTDYSQPDVVENLIIEPKINKDGSIRSDFQDKVIKCDEIYISSDLNKLFSGLFEIIYQVRNILVHGSLNPRQDEHNVVKYCYLILWSLINEG